MRTSIITIPMRSKNQESRIKNQVILGIDPGIADTGYGVILKTGSRIKVLDYGSIKTKPRVPDEQPAAADQRAADGADQ